jgi:hypothetical protein
VSERNPPQRLFADIPPAVFYWILGVLLFALAVSATLATLDVRKSRKRDPERRVCPACGGTHVRPSYPGGPRDALYRIFGLEPYRCRACTYRFYRPEHHRLGG